MENSSRLLSFDALISALIVIFGCSWMPLIDPDYFWHLKNGQLIQQAGSLFTVEPFSHTANGTPIIVTDWLFDLLLASVFRWFGDAGTRALVALFAVLTWQIMFRVARLKVERRETAALLALAGFAFLTPVLAPRPNLFTHLAFAFVFWMLLAYLQDRSIRHLVPLIPLFALWANMHYGFASGLVLFALFMLSAVIDRIWPFGGDLPLDALLDWKVFAVFALCVTAAALNPIGLAIYPEFLKMSSRAVQSSVIEWASPDFKSFYGQLTQILLLGYVILQVRSPPIRSWLPVLVPLFMLMGYLNSARNVPFLGIVLVGFAAMSYPTTENGKPLADQSGRASALTGIFHLILVGVALIVANAGAPIFQAKMRSVSDPILPVAATDFLLASVPPGRMFNSYDSGGYLLFRGFPNYPVFIDGRYYPYNDAVHQAHQMILSGAQGALQALQRYRIEIVLIPRRSGLTERFAVTNEYRRVYADAFFAIYVLDVEKFSVVPTLLRAAQ